MKATFARWRFGIEQRLTFYRDLRNFVEAGMAPFTAITEMLQVSRRRRSLSWLTKILIPISAQGTRGRTLAVALGPWVPRDEAAMIAAGEASGQLGQALGEVLAMMENKRAITENVRSFVGPVFFRTVVVVGLFYFNVTQVLGKAKSMLPEGSMERTRIAGPMMRTADFMLGPGALIILGLAIAATLMFVTLHRWRPGRLRQWLDNHFPVYTLYARIQSAYFMLACSSMMSAGRPFNEVVEDLQRLAGPWQQAYLRRMLARLAHGKADVEALRVGMIPWDIENKLAVYSLVPNFTQVMKSCAKEAMASVQTTLNLYGKLTNICFMIGAGAIVVLTSASMMDISSAVRAAGG